MKDSLTSIISPSAVISGRLTFKSEARIEGQLQGEIISEGKLIIGKDAVVEGTVVVRELLVQGTMKGDIFVSKLATLQKTAIVHANLNATRIIMIDGAQFQGNLVMGEDAMQNIPEELKLNASIIKDTTVPKQ